MSFSAVGTLIQLRFNMKYPTFTPDQCKQTLIERKYTLAQRSLPNIQNPQAGPLVVPFFSKGNINVLLSPNSQQVLFQIQNTIDLTKTYKELQDILHSLNIYNDVIRDVGLNCRTRTRTNNKPQDTLTELIDSEFLKGLEKSLEIIIFDTY